MILIVANIAVFFVELGLSGNEATRFLYTYALGDAAYRFAEARFSPEACFGGLLAEIDRPAPRAGNP